MEDEKLYQVALTLIPKVGDVLIKQLIAYSGSARAVFESNKSKLQKIPGIGPKVAAEMDREKLLSLAETQYEKALKMGVDLFFFTDADYPKRLKSVIDAPALLYFKGAGDLNASRQIAIVGTRNATDYGKEVTQDIVKQLKGFNCGVVSGLAYGIDITAHRAALQENLPTFAVLGSSVDIIYPAVHKDTAKALTETGGLVSELPLGTKPEMHYFPARNRIIAALSDATIVVEAAARGGALITAELAHGYDREVLAVPGNLDLRYSEGCNKLISKLKATIYTGKESLEEVLNWSQSEVEQESPMALDAKDFSTEEWQVITTLAQEKGEAMIDGLSWKSQIPINRLAGILLQLEFKGLVRALPGKKFRLVK